MKQYKLIKTFPGSPKLGTIEEPIGKIHQMSNGNYGYNISKTPEYWEEVIEKDYKILLWRDDSYKTPIIYKVDKEGKFTGTPKIGPYFTQEDAFYEIDFNIHSVKRKSDSEIFTVGDMVKTKYFKGELKTITLKSNIIFINLDTYINKCEFTAVLNDLTKTKKPLFTTEDNYKVYKDDFYWCVNTAPHLWSIFQQIAKENTKLNKGVLAFKSVDLAEKYVEENKPKKLFTTEDGVDIFEGDEFFRVWNTNGELKRDSYRCFADNKYSAKMMIKTCPHFSTKEKAEEYILVNKPCLSIKDIKEAMKKGLSVEGYLIKLVKSRL